MACDHARAEREIQAAATWSRPDWFPGAFEACERRKAKDGAVGFGYWCQTLRGFTVSGGPDPPRPGRAAPAQPTMQNHNPPAPVEPDDNPEETAKTLKKFAARFGRAAP
jgi:hypothetical protein